MWILNSEKEIEHDVGLQISEFLEKFKISLEIFDLDYYNEEKFKELFIRFGPTHFLSPVNIQEELLKKVRSTDRRDVELLLSIIQKKLHLLKPNKSLIVIDNYIFPPNVRDLRIYTTNLLYILDRTIGNITNLHFITKPNYHQSLYNHVQTEIQNQNKYIITSLKTTDEFHDRFWITDQQSGLLIGTSLNGIGKRYAIVDNLKEPDVLEIIGELKSNDLLF